MMPCPMPCGAMMLNLRIVIYPGADGSFILYEDEGDGYGYEDGAFSTIEFRWNNAARSLTIGPRKGSFPGMLMERDFVLQVQGSSPVKVHYDGKEQILAIRDTGLTNMFDIRMVQRLAYDRHYYELVTFIEENPAAYVRFIFTGETDG